MGLKMFSMFSGIGGFELPLGELGIKCVGLSEINTYAIQVLTKNFKCLNYGDAKLIDTDFLPNFDILCAGFPCQDFSIAGKRKGMRYKGATTRSGLFTEILRVLEDKHPKYIFLENVKGMLNLRNKDNSKYAFDEIMIALSDLGYYLDFAILNSKDFGLAQNRQRVIVFGTLDKQSSSKITDEIRDRLIKINVNLFDSFLHNKIRIKKVVLKDIIQKSANINIINKNIEIKKIPHPNSDIKCIGIIPESIKPKGNYFPRERVFSIDGISRALTTVYAHLPMYQISKRIRKLTPIECERLMGFPDNWTKLGIENRKTVSISDANRYFLLGNAVPINIIREITKEFLKWKK